MLNIRFELDMRDDSMRHPMPMDYFPMLIFRIFV